MSTFSTTAELEARARISLRWLLLACAALVAVGYVTFIFWLYGSNDMLANRHSDGIPGAPGSPAVVHHLRGDVFVVSDRGMNVTVAAGRSGLLLVDTAEPPALEALDKGLDRISSLPVRFIVNTHAHHDHMGGNAFFARDGADIIATKAAADLMRADLGELVAPRNPAGFPLPNITFEDSYELRLGDETVQIVHIPDAHSPGDAVIRFVNANVIVTGDAFVDEGLPYIADDLGMTIDGYLRGMLTIADMSDDETILVPGHGPAVDRGRLLETYDRLKRIRDTVAFWKGLGVPQKFMLATYPTFAWPLRWHKYGVSQKWFAKVVYRTVEFSD
ncbi:MAG: MBL fold metallo-hydrolase [Paracoccaceae bacterium]